MKTSIAVLGLCLTLQPTTWARAAIPNQSKQVSSPIKLTTQAPADEELARDWGLRTEEWSRYKQLMQGPLGIYAPNLDPLTALGIEARTDDERRHYAELQVTAEARRVDKTLAYQRAYDAAWQRMRPDAQRVVMAGAAPSRQSPQGMDGRMAVFVRADCTLCDQRVRQMQAAGISFDVYMVGSLQNDAAIRQWASRAGVDPSKVRARAITLNHDAGRWLSIGVGGELPAVVRQVNGQWLRQ
jgi:integrating conjugative element protein (TIGR03759 family)